MHIWRQHAYLWRLDYARYLISEVSKSSHDIFLLIDSWYRIFQYFCLGCSTANPCANGGTCVDGSCMCTTDFWGYRCQYGKIFDLYSDHYSVQSFKVAILHTSQN